MRLRMTITLLAVAAGVMFGAVRPAIAAPALNPGSTWYLIRVSASDHDIAPFAGQHRSRRIYSNGTSKHTTTAVSLDCSQNTTSKAPQTLPHWANVAYLGLCKANSAHEHDQDQALGMSGFVSHR